ncbi:hypothetical protein GLAREA_05626 [Glarea lozoyensis ATCC 20868]|uniref:Uncharacterized protein n=1 Tax=Glarea lozoyensis (strain ATCC 20868 / MF5171) TaxID=1116229 RepID=S3EDD1_GLAL2|nr:uncharacterized protein GLAREA_05626 [Glarea lozoyensis ATCC 20868]EPE36288.1 hypothetical protein GLAREA_05626 [Glarea lozoyensis ATCC 20868]
MPPLQPWTPTECALLAYYTANNNANLRRLHLTYGTVGAEIMKEVKYLRAVEPGLELPSVDRLFTERTIASKVLRMRKKGEGVVGREPRGPGRRVRGYKDVGGDGGCGLVEKNEVNGEMNWVGRVPIGSAVTERELDVTTLSDVMTPPRDRTSIQEVGQAPMYVDPRELQKDFMRISPPNDMTSHTSPRYSEQLTNLPSTPLSLSKNHSSSLASTKRNV